MAWDALKKWFEIKPVVDPIYEVQKLIWNDAAQIEVRVKEVVVEQLEIEPSSVTLQAQWYRDYFCSDDVVEVFMCCEEVFGIEIPDDLFEYAEDSESVGGLVNFIQQWFDCGTPAMLERYQHISVSIKHPSGTVETTLQDWIERGPGSQDIAHPSRAKDLRTGESLPLNVVPLKYRNDKVSWSLIERGILGDPWK